MTVAIVDYGSGNLHSARRAFERCAQGGETILVTSDPDAIAAADRIVLPGVGAFADCKRGLDERSGLIDALNEAVRNKGTPFLGICVGMQLMATRGLEYAETRGLGWIDGDVTAIRKTDIGMKIPHMGWNTLHAASGHPVLEGIDTGDGGLHAYFVHSFHLAAASPEDVVATTPYGEEITAIVARNNWVGVQFHPEKSQTLGLRLIANFLDWRP